jgi:hypothetical protein
MEYWLVDGTARSGHSTTQVNIGFGTKDGAMAGRTYVAFIVPPQGSSWGGQPPLFFSMNFKPF